MGNYLDQTGLQSVLSNIKTWATNTFAPKTLKTINGESIVGSGNISISGGSGGSSPSDLADYVIEQGDNGYWTYTKWKSGKCELWRHYTATFAMSTSNNGWYTTAAERTLTLPFSVMDAIVDGSGIDAPYVVRGSVEDTTLTWRPYRIQSSSSTERKFQLHIKGFYEYRVGGLS